MKLYGAIDLHSNNSVVVVSDELDRIAIRIVEIKLTAGERARRAVFEPQDLDAFGLEVLADPLFEGEARVVGADYDGFHGVLAHPPAFLSIIP